MIMTGLLLFLVTCVVCLVGKGGGVVDSFRTIFVVFGIYFSVVVVCTGGGGDISHCGSGSFLFILI